MLETRVETSLRAIDRAQWEALQRPDPLESYDYLLAVEEAGLPGFAWRYVLVEDAGELVAAAPIFLTDYALETTLVGAGKALLEGMRRVFPGPSS